VNSQSTVEMWMKRADEGRTVKPLYTQPQPTQKGSVPEGWKLVPVEPTGDMEEAGCQGYMEADGNWVMHRSSMGFAYKAMLEAAPAPTTPTPEGDGSLWDYPTAPDFKRPQPPQEGSGNE